MTVEHTAPSAGASAPLTALAPWLPPRTARSRPAPLRALPRPDRDPTDGDPTDGDPTDGDPTDSQPIDREPTDGQPIHRLDRPVTVAVEVTVAGAGALTLGAEIADRLRALATTLAQQAGSGDVAVNAALVLSGDRPAHEAGSVDGRPQLRILRAQRTVLVAGESIELTRREFDLLLHLARQPGRVFTRTQLLQAVWGHAYISGERTVDVHVRRIRAKLGGYETAVKTVRGVGYRFAGPGLADVVDDE